MPCCNTAPHKRLQRVLCHKCSYKAHTTKQCTELCRVISSYLPCFAVVVWRVHPAMLYSLQGAGRHTDKRNVSADTRYQRRAGRCAAHHSRPIIIRYTRVQGCAPVIDPCQTVQHIADHASPAGSRCFQRPAACSLAPGQPDTLHPAGQSSSRGAAGGAEPLTAFAATLFGLSPDS